MSLHLAHLTAAELPIAATVLDAAYGPAPDRALVLERYLAIQPDGWLLAREHTTPVGMVGAVRYGRVAYVGMMAVHPAWQRRGIGLALMQRLLTELADHGCTTALLDATEAGVPLYRRLGFSDRGATSLFQAARHTPGPGPDERVRPFQPADLPALLTFDASSFGARRDHALTSLLALYAARSWVLHDDSEQLAGYVIAQEQTIGPWAAHAGVDAERLLGAALTLSYPNPPRVIVPGTNPAVAALLANRGFQLGQVVRHMGRGPFQRVPAASDLYGQASFVLG